MPVRVRSSDKVRSSQVRLRAGLGWICCFWLTLFSVQGEPVAFSFSQFTNSSALLVHGAAAVQGGHIELGATREYRAAGAWFQHKGFLENGFSTAFTFQMPAGTHEGFAFVIQNNPVPAVGAGGRGMGYEGVANSVAIEFDTRRNSDHPDIASGHISINTRGIYANSANHDASLAASGTGLPELADGNPHIATIHYQPGRVQVFLDSTNVPRVELRCDLAKLINLDSGQAWIGFTSDGALANAQVTSWSFTPAQGPSVGLSSPLNNSVYAFGAPITLTGTGVVSRVDFFDGPTLLGSDATAPFQLNWTNALPGRHAITTVGHAASGVRSASRPLKVTVAPLQPPIGINFARGGGGTNYSLEPSQIAGLVPQSQWNNAVPSTGLGSGSASNLRDGGGSITPAAVQFQFNGPGEELGTDTALSPDHQIMRAYLANNALVFPPSTSSVRVVQIPFSAYDVIVYSDSDNRGFDRVTEFRIGSEWIFLRDQANATFAGHFAEARGTANLGLNTPAGNYVRFRGLTNDNFTLEVFERSFADYSRRAVVNAIQIVSTAPSSPVKSIQVVRGPYLQSGASDGVTVCWRTDRPTNAVVRYGTSPGDLNFSVTASETGVDHAVRIPGLAPDTRYYYALGASGTNFPPSNENFFLTSPTQTRPVRIWAIGDAGTADYSAASVRDGFLDHTRDHKPELMLFLGDNAYNNGSDSEYQAAVFDMFAPTLRQTVAWSAMGNHETYTIDMPYLRIFNFPTNGECGGVPSGSELYYSFNYANIHFVCLESTIENRWPDGPMLTWLRADLAAHNKHWLIVYIHAPPYSQGSHSSDDPGEIEMWEVREFILPVLEEHGVDLILSGNSHGYERSMLVDGFYGTTDAWDPQYIVQDGTGRPDDSGAYVKAGLGVAPHSGTVVVVAGNAGVVRSDYGLDHPAMVSGLRKLGSLLIDVDGPNLTARMIRENGTVGDYFSIRKGISRSIPEVSISARTGIMGESVPASPVFDIRRSGPTNDPLRVFYGISGTADNGRDFSRVPRSAIIPAGAESVPITISPMNDGEIENPEGLTLSLQANTTPFRLVVLPDTRAYIGETGGGTRAMFEAQARWITAQADALNIAFVLHTGDITENNSSAEWTLAQTHLQIPVPLALVPGDHDGLSGPVAQTAGFNSAFPVSAIRTRPEFGGVFETNKLDNAFYYFSGGGIDWLVLSLEFLPRDPVVDWANRIIAAHPERKVIVLTHWFLAEDDSIPESTQGGRENTPVQLWEKLLRRHANVAFVFNGHTDGDGVARRVDTGDYGNKVVQIAANFSNQLNGGNGYLRVLEFDPSQDRVRVETFSPYLNASKIDPENQFDVPELGLFRPYHGRYTIHTVSNTATVTIQDNDTDTTRPVLLTARAVGPANQIVLTFSEPLNELNANDPANYSVDNFAINSAVLLSDGKTVVLTLGSPMQDGASYTIRVSNIRDRAMPPNIISPSTNIDFTHRLVFLAETFEDPAFPGWLVVDEGTIDAPSIWRAPAGKLDQSSSIHGPDPLATENRQGTYVYWSAPEALAWNNYIVRAAIRTPDDDAVGLLFWFQDAANYYKLEFDRRNSFYRLLAITSGFEVVLAEENGTFPLNSDLIVSVEVVDDRIYAALNGQPLFGGIITNSSSGSGTVGLYCWNSAGVTFDDVEVIPSPPNDPPTVSLTAPAPNTLFLAPANLALSANASDADGIQQVEFFANQELLSIARQGPPYSFTWSNVPPGQYTLTAVAKDTRGFSTVSSPVPIDALLLNETFQLGTFAGWTIRDEGNIDGPSLWEVSSGALLQKSNIYGPSSTATEGRLGTCAVWDDSSAYRWRDYVVKATLISSDDDGIGLLFRYRDPNNYYKLEFDAQRDFRRLVRKLNGVETALVSEPGGYSTNVPFAVEVKVIDGKVEARVDGGLLFGGQISDSTLPIGSIALYCWGNSGAAFDNVRVSALSPPNQSPSVTLLNPADNSSFVPPVNITLLAEASDSDGSIQAVDFLAGEAVLGTATTRPYTLAWANVALGAYSLRARATDNFGVQTLSAPVNIAVDYPPGHLVLRSAAITSPGVIAFRIEAPLNAPVVIESSSDLQQWTPIATVTNVTTFSTSTPVGQGMQFYRAREP